MAYPVAACRGSKTTASALFAPSSPAGLTAVQLWLRGGADWMRAAADGTGGAMADTNEIGRWVQPGDSLTTPAFRYTTEATNKPTLTIASGFYTANAASTKLLTASTTLSLTNNFILWAVVKSDLSAAFHVCGAAGTFGAISVGTSGQISFRRDSGATVSSNNGAVAASTRTLIRVRRVSGNVSFAATGYAETTQASAGTFTLDRLLMGSGATTAVVADLGELLISTDAATAATPPASIDGVGGYFDTNAYLGSTAWGVSL